MPVVVLLYPYQKTVWKEKESRMMGLIIDLFFATLSIVIFLAKIFFMAPIFVIKKLFGGYK